MMKSKPGPWKKGQQAFVIRMNEQARFVVQRGRVARLTGEAVFVRLPLAEGDSVVVDYTHKDLYRTEAEAQIACVRRTAAAIYGWAGELIGLCNRLSH